MHSKPQKPETDHLAGLPPLLMCQLEERLQTRIRAAIFESGEVAERGAPGRGQMIGYAWRSLWAMDAEELSRDILHRMMNKRIRDGKQFDSILEASRKHFAQSLFARAMSAGSH